MISRTARMLGIEQGEGRVAGLVASLAFVTMASYAVGQSGIDALFFNRIGPQSLPLLYVLQGGTSFAAMLALTGTLGRLGRRRFYLSAPVALAAVILGERAVLLSGFAWIYFLLSVTGVLAALVLGIFIWGTAGTVVDTRQAKRLFPIFAAGGIFGSVIGGALTPPLARAIATENLLLAWVVGLVVAFLVSRIVLGPPASASLRRVARKNPSTLHEVSATFGFVRQSRLLVWMAVTAVLFSILFYLLYLPYARAATLEFPKTDELAGFFGLFWAASTLAAFLVSTLVTNHLFAWRGVGLMVVVLAALYGAAFGVLVFASGFVILVGLRLVLCTWLEGVASPGWETLTNVVPDGRRDQVRAFLNGGPTQIGTMIAGLLALVGQETLTPRQFASVGLGAAALAVAATIAIRRSYAGALANALRAGRPQIFDRLVAPRPLLLGPTADSDQAVEDVLQRLGDRDPQTDGLAAFHDVDTSRSRDRLRALALTAVEEAVHDRDLAAAVAGEDDASALLRDAIMERGRRAARSGLWAAALLHGRRDALAIAIENLDGGSAQVAAALETIETAGDPALVRPLLTLWDKAHPAVNGDGDGLSSALHDTDGFIRECAQLVQIRQLGAQAPRPAVPLAGVKRVLFLRKVPLFAGLSALDLEHIARLTQERSYRDGEVIGGEGELGEELFIVVEGTVRIVRGRKRDERELARRGPGEVIGEMSLITQAPRMASLVADGPVRTLPVGRREFESVLRERPAVALAVMRVLVQRLG